MNQEMLVCVSVSNKEILQLSGWIRNRLIGCKFLESSFDLVAPIAIDSVQAPDYLNDISEILRDEPRFIVQSSHMYSNLDELSIVLGIRKSPALQNLHDELLVARQTYVGKVVMPSLPWPSVEAKLNYQAHRAVHVGSLYDPHIVLAKSLMNTVQFAELKRMLPSPKVLDILVDTVHVYTKKQGVLQKYGSIPLSNN